MDLAIISGFGDKGMDKLEGSLNDAIPFDSSTVIASAPWYRALQHPETIVSNVSNELEKMDSDELVVVGHSYGSLMALGACVDGVRHELDRIFLLDRILRLVLIDGPLRSDCDVPPAKMTHNLFFRHYAYRKQLAEKCEKALKDLDTSKIVTIGSQIDRIVPPESKHLDGVHHVILPPEYKGHSINRRIDIVTEITKASLDGVLSSKVWAEQVQSEQTRAEQNRRVA